MERQGNYETVAKCYTREYGGTDEDFYGVQGVVGSNPITPTINLGTKWALSLSWEGFSFVQVHRLALEFVSKVMDMRANLISIKGLLLRHRLSP